MLKSSSKLIVLLCSVCGVAVAEDLSRQAETVNRIIWRRFIGPDNVMYDYAGLNGEVILPTPEECERNIPNALAWWTPIENGGFFNGMYLIAQCERYNRNKTAENREKVKRLVLGLYKLQDVAATPGFISRGVGSDGKAHYPASSNDQNFPWFMGLGKYLETDIPTTEERRDCIARLSRHGDALAKRNWLMIGDKPDFERGWWLDQEYASCVHIATATRVLFEATGDKKWREMHYRLLNELLKSGKTRRQNIAEGATNMAGWSAWFLSNCQYAVRELYFKENDPELKKLYAESLKNTAGKAEPLIGAYKNFDPAKERPAFTPDWHVMMPPYNPQKNGAEAQKLALEQNVIWGRKCPAIAEEKGIIKPALCAAWIVALSEDPALVQRHRAGIEKMIQYFDYSKLYYATFFYVENIVNTLEEK